MLAALILLAAAGAMVCWGLGDFFIQRVIRKVGTLEALALIGIVGTVVLLPFVIHDFGYFLRPGPLLLLGCLGIATYLTAVLDFEALKVGKLAIVEVLLTLELPVTVLLGIFIFRERLSLLQGGLIALIFLGVVLMALETNPFAAAFRWEKGAVLGLLSALLLGFINFLTAAAAKLTTPWMAIWITSAVIGLLSLIAIGHRHGLRAMLIRTGRWHWIVLAMGLLDTAAWLFYAIATRHGELSIVTAITESYPVIAIVLGVWLNRERIRKHQWLGAALAIGLAVTLAIVS